MRVRTARWLGVVVGGLLLFAGIAWGLLWRAEIPRVDFLAFAPHGEGEYAIEFRLSNSNRFDYHYSIQTLPSLRSDEATIEVGLLPANASLTNKIPFQVLNTPFRLEVQYYRLPVLPSRWLIEPRLSWACVKAFARGESRLMFAFRGELPTNHLLRARSPELEGLTADRFPSEPLDEIAD